ncbi:MAG: phosphotransferase, partial [Nanoarchaeota archaeon]|nr:phosphotransferase [Nanoarchaeota archaeon]
AGIYHRDLHDRNIMIDEENDKAIIIDLGTATTNPNISNPQNRLYGGNNDLISLGQLMYKMATGHNLFNEENGQSQQSPTKNHIKTEREKAYETKETLQPYLNKVKENIQESNLAKLITNILDDKLWTQPDKEKVEETKKTIEEYLSSV